MYVGVSKSRDASFSRQDKVYILLTPVLPLSTFPRVSKISARRQQLIFSNHDSVWTDRNTTVANGPLLKLFNFLTVSVSELQIKQLFLLLILTARLHLMLLIHQTLLSKCVGTIPLTIINSCCFNVNLCKAEDELPFLVKF